MKQIRVMSSTITDPNKLTTTSSYVGRKVFSRSGNEIGKVKDSVMLNHALVGFVVKGKNKMIIGKEYIASESKDSIILSIDPVTELMGKQVFDKAGKLLGKVNDVQRQTNSNNFIALIVRNKIYSKPIVIPKKDIDNCQENIMLSKIFNPK